MLFIFLSFAKKENQLEIPEMPTLCIWILGTVITIIATPFIVFASHIHLGEKGDFVPNKSLWYTTIMYCTCLRNVNGVWLLINKMSLKSPLFDRGDWNGRVNYVYQRKRDPGFRVPALPKSKSRALSTLGTGHVSKSLEGKGVHVSGRKWGWKGIEEKFGIQNGAFRRLSASHQINVILKFIPDIRSFQNDVKACLYSLLGLV